MKELTITQLLANVRVVDDSVLNYDGITFGLTAVTADIVNPAYLPPIHVTGFRNTPPGDSEGPSLDDDVQVSPRNPALPRLRLVRGYVNDKYGMRVRPFDIGGYIPLGVIATNLKVHSSIILKKTGFVLFYDKQKNDYVMPKWAYDAITSKCRDSTKGTFAPLPLLTYRGKNIYIPASADTFSVNKNYTTYSTKSKESGAQNYKAYTCEYELIQPYYRVVFGSDQYDACSIKLVPDEPSAMNTGRTSAGTDNKVIKARGNMDGMASFQSDTFGLVSESNDYASLLIDGTFFPYNRFEKE